MNSWDALKATAPAGLTVGAGTVPGAVPGTVTIKKETLGLADLATPALVQGCGFIAKRKGEHWETDDKEARQMLEAIEEALPEGYEVSPVWGAVLAVAAFTIPRLVMDKVTQNAPASTAIQNNIQQPAQKQITQQPAQPVIKTRQKMAQPASSRGR